MNEYIIYTTEGHTTAPDDTIEVENCQVLGIVKAVNVENALETLLLENSWLNKSGFDKSKFIIRQMMTDK